MKNECSIVRDILPLYLEGMVSDDTAEFIAEHLCHCTECRSEYETLQQAGILDLSGPERVEQRKEAATALIAIKKKLKTKSVVTIAVTAISLLAIILALCIFPIYRIVKVWSPSYYDTGEISMLAYIGTPGDRSVANTIIRQAEDAFSDISHTREENEEAYGVLSRYATTAERGAFEEKHSLELWSARFDASSGYMWVFYSRELFNANGELISGSKDIPSLWYVEKNEDGKWVVVGIKERP